MNAEVKHTPGPWLNAGRSAGSHIHADKGEVAWLRSYMGIDDEQIDANARLIAAAPELLDALKYIAKTWPDDFAARHARAAIAKVEARS